MKLENDKGSAVDRSALIIQGLKASDTVMLRQTLRDGIRAGVQGKAVIKRTCQRLNVSACVKLFSYLAHKILTDANIRVNWPLRWIDGLIETRNQEMNYQFKTNRALNTLRLRLISYLNHVKISCSSLNRVKGTVEYWS